MLLLFRFAVTTSILAFLYPAIADDLPDVLDPAWKIELVASEPKLVTPTGCCFDDAGRLLVVECHTHFAPEGYAGPKTDRIHLFDDSDGDGKLDRQRLFYEGGQATMGIVKLDEGWFAVSTRSNVVRIRDSNQDDVADEREVLITLKTPATYPHNGLTGLATSPDGWLYVGQGENLGEPYELIAADDSKQVGGGEGGNMFRCRFDGRELQRHATGFWNPFGITMDPAGRLWTVGNDPDASPPCRLLHVIRGGDYGFQFRFGRAGTHPLLAWNGELPGTLGMVAGTGEAPCAVIVHGEHLWVTSWGDNRIERYALKALGATWTSQTETVVQGDALFRPVGMANAPDGSIYFTDWVDRSYPVHQKGRLWRLSRKKSEDTNLASFPKLSESEQKCMRLLHDNSLDVDQRLAALSDDDPAIRQSAINGLVDTKQLDQLERDRLVEPLAKIGVLTAWRWRDLLDPQSLAASQRDEWLEWGLKDSDQQVNLAALRWATERRSQSQLPAIRKLLELNDLKPKLFSGVMASIAYLESGSASGGKRDPQIEKLLTEFASDEKRPAKLRAIALGRLPAESEQPTAEQMGQWLSADVDRTLAIAIVYLLTARANKPALDVLASLAANEELPDQTRADAIAGLARNVGEYAKVVNPLALPRQPEVIRTEAERVLRRSWQSSSPRPDRSDLDAWDKLVGSGGNVDAGRRVFFRTTCVNCHQHSGRGAKTGPDLTTVAGTSDQPGAMTSKRVLESILHPSKEVGPLYVAWRIVTTEGRVLTGLKLDAPGAGERIRFQGADGDPFEVGLEEIESQGPVETSIMPTGLEDAMSLEELRDLIAFLTVPVI
jgi:putative membrane-bound dehydrogenase-like protein